MSCPVIRPKSLCSAVKFKKSSFDIWNFCKYPEIRNKARWDTPGGVSVWTGYDNADTPGGVSLQCHCEVKDHDR